MKSRRPVPRVTRGYARNAKDEARLKAAGVRTIYVEGRGGESFSRIKLRKGEYLGVVDGLLAFGDTRRDMMAALKAVHAAGAMIIDAETGICSRRSGAEMLDAALSPKRPSAEYMAALGEKSARSRTKGRMPKHEALVIWRNAKLSMAEALELMKGWRQATAYTQLGKRFAIAGRRPNKKP